MISTKITILHVGCGLFDSACARVCRIRVVLCLSYLANCVSVILRLRGDYSKVYSNNHFLVLTVVK